MTMQIPEILVFNECKYVIHDLPLASYLKNEMIVFEVSETACYRGYYGEWLIEGEKLYLVNLSGQARLLDKVRFNKYKAEMKHLLKTQIINQKEYSTNIKKLKQTLYVESECQNINLAKLFHNKEKVLADWFTGELDLHKTNSDLIDWFSKPQYKIKVDKGVVVGVNTEGE